MIVTDGRILKANLRWSPYLSERSFASKLQVYQWFYFNLFWQKSNLNTWRLKSGF